MMPEWYYPHIMDNQLDLDDLTRKHIGAIPLRPGGTPKTFQTFDDFPKFLSTDQELFTVNQVQRRFSV
jgi:hypothetical protein